MSLAILSKHRSQQFENMTAIRKGQLATTESAAQTPAEQFYALAA
jgi:hypothetical protein